MIERFRRWLDYERDAHAKVVSSLESVPEHNRSLPEYQRAVSILGHVAAARRIWLFRLGVTTEKPSEMFPKDRSLSQVSDDLHTDAQLWEDHLATLTNDDLARPFEYQSIDAGRFRNTIEDILIQLYGHSLYHRGQIAMLVKTAGGSPAATDFIYWSRASMS